jgi:class 3 adenylate cyclase
MDIGAWLRGLNLERYEGAFRENDIDTEVLPDLTADDLTAMGVTSVGHRRKLLAAIVALKSEPALPSDTHTVERDRVSTSNASRTPTEAERRHLTVVFCDLVGSTALAGRLDPEDLREVLGTYHAAASEEVARLDGFVAKFMGDGVLAYFGYPQAHEDDPERAIRAALAIADRVAALNPASGALAVRVGIATGLVVVGDLIGSGEAQERGVVGETPNLAARLQALAEPNSILIAGATRQLVGDLFEYRDLGTVEIRGFDDPVPVWQVLRQSRVESRFEAFHATALTPLVGREEETDLLLRRWHRAKSGEGQVVLISGEPGIGKSRLIAALQEQLGDDPHTTLRYFCSTHHRDSALYPFIAQIERAAGFDREDPPETRLDKLEAVLGQSEKRGSETAALLADLLSVPAGGRYPPGPADPQRQRELTLAALIGQLQMLSQQRPVLMMFEDAHWADSTSLELLDRAVEHTRQLPVLIVITFRPEFQAPWVGQAHVTSMGLSRLAQRETTVLVDCVTGGKALPAEILDQIVERTDGIPLFVEELTKMLLEGSLLREEETRYTLTGPLPPLGIPSSLQASLLARLDRLMPVKEVAQIGAALGREFSYELLAAVARHGDAELREALDQLMEAGLVFRRGNPPHASFMFKHALVQDTAYNTLLRRQRQELHVRIGKVLEEQFPETVESQPEILAHHFAEGGLVGLAIEYWIRAGARSVGRSAHTEAIGHFGCALDLLRKLPPTQQRDERDLELTLSH